MSQGRTMRKGSTRAATAALIVGALASSACVMTKSADESTPNDDIQDVPTTTLPTPVRAELGVEQRIGDVVAEVVAIAPATQTTQGRPQISVEVRSENNSHTPLRNPIVELICSDREGPGAWADGSTWEPGSPLAVNAVLEGIVIVGFPQSGAGAEYPSTTCADALVRLTIRDTREFEVGVYDYPVDSEIIDAAVRAPTVALPLPYAGS